MTKKLDKWINRSVDLLFVLLAGYYFFHYVKAVLGWKTELYITVGVVCVTVLQALIIHLIKSLRLYLLVFENSMSLEEFLKMYAETLIVNQLLPYKSGELYRGFRIGRSCASMVQGYAAVMLDRFIDTLALISTMVLISVLFSAPVMPIVIAFLVFCVLLIVIYCLFPPLYKYLNDFFLFDRSSEATLFALHVLKILNNAHGNIHKMAHGRFLLLYLLSVIAWAVEVCGLILVRGVSASVDMGEYLQNAVLGNPSEENVVYFFVCLAFFVLVSLTIRIRDLYRREKDVSARCV